MAYPVSGNYEVRVSGTTTVKKAWADANDAALNGIYGGTKTLVSVQTDATGYQAATANAGDVSASGNVVSVGDVHSLTGKIYTTLGNIEATAGYFKSGLSITSGTGGSGQAVPVGELFGDTMPFAWGVIRINHAGVGNVGILRSANVASVTYVNTGKYRVTLQTAAPNYLCPVVNMSTTTAYYHYIPRSTVTTSVFEVWSSAADGNAFSNADPGNDDLFFFHVFAG